MLIKLGFKKWVETEYKGKKMKFVNNPETMRLMLQIKDKDKLVGELVKRKLATMEGR